MRWPRARLTVRHMMMVVASLSLVFAFAAAEVRKQRLRSDYHRETRRFIVLFMLLSDRMPEGLNRTGWDEALQAIYQASYSSGLSESTESVNALARLCDDFEKKLKGPIGPETLRWLWGRFGQTGTAGKRYTESHVEGFDQYIKWCLGHSHRRPTRR